MKRRRAAFRFLVAGTAAFGLFAVILNHGLIGLPDSESKRVAIVALALVLAAVAAVPLWLHWRGPWTRGAAVVVVVLLAGELRRAWLRYGDALESSGIPSIELLHPVTTLDLRRVHFEQALPGLPAPHLRVLELSDLHITEALPSDYYARIEREIAASDADLLFLTGDYLSTAARFPLLERWLAALPRARYGNFAVLGNHDQWVDPERSRAVLARAGVTVLSGRCTLVPVPGGSGIRLCGTEAPWGPALDAAAIASGAPGASPLFVIAHSARSLPSLHALGASVVFAGHTHGGQMRLPLIGAIIVPDGRRFDLGHFNVDGTHLWVSAGVGADEPPLRIYCPPELVEVDFRP
ncbi:MAG TPA: metallophosphoesterase [Polyangiaceae bacterium]|nr:metallophosphoesterase [Polyangiaceae bacterium]